MSPLRRLKKPTILFVQAYEASNHRLKDEVQLLNLDFAHSFQMTHPIAKMKNQRNVPFSLIQTKHFANSNQRTWRKTVQRLVDCVVCIDFET